jgi:thiamine transporter
MPARRTRLLTEIAVAVALAIVLGMFRLYRLPWGGALSLKILPLLYVALRRGPAAGMTAGGLTGLLTLILDPVIIHPVQVLLDYILPYLALGLAGWFPAFPRTGIGVAGLMRLASHVVSGVVYFAAYAPPEINIRTYHVLADTLGLSLPLLLEDWTVPWVYSLLYNGSVVLPESLLMILIMPYVLRRLAKRG